MKALCCIIFSLIVSVPIFGQQLDAPQIKCMSVLPNGNVQITWDQITDPLSQFLSYRLYDEFGTILTNITNITTNTHVHAGSAANSASRCYYIQSVSTNSANNSVNSDTVCTMFLTTNNPGNGTAWLVWNEIHNPNLPLMSSWYHIYREFPAGVWTLIDSTAYGTQSYVDTIDICSSVINYKIVVESDGCSSESNVDGGFFTDIIAPYAPVIDYITVDTATNNVWVSWNPSQSLDADAYILLHFIPGTGWAPIDTIWGWGNTTYIHVGAGADALEQSYGLAAFDSCWSVSGSPNTSAMGTFHTTMHLTSTPDVCDNGVILDWTEYMDWGSGVTSYEVFGNNNGGAMVSFGTTTQSDMQLVGLNPNDTYCFVIKATSGDGQTSMSNKICYTIYVPGQPTVGYLTTATVSGETIILKYLGDVAASIQSINVQRATDSWGPFVTVGSTAITGAITTYVDQNVEPSEKDYYYRIIAVDSCGNETFISNVGRTIHLRKATNQFTSVNTLAWNYYGDWDGGIQEYRVLRSINGSFSGGLLATIAPFGNILEDDVSDLLETSGEFCYYIQAVEFPNSYGIQEVSNSNIVCTYMEPLVWIPNAFTPTGFNPIFKPEMGYISPTEYSFRIYDRWGQNIFETNDLTMGWDGKIRGSDGPNGVYVYHLIYKIADQTFHEKRGTVTLVR